MIKLGKGEEIKQSKTWPTTFSWYPRKKADDAEVTRHLMNTEHQWATICSNEYQPKIFSAVQMKGECITQNFDKKHLNFWTKKSQMRYWHLEKLFF